MLAALFSGCSQQSASTAPESQAPATEAPESQAPIDAAPESAAPETQERRAQGLSALGDEDGAELAKAYALRQAPQQPTPGAKGTVLTGGGGKGLGSGASGPGGGGGGGTGGSGGGNAKAAPT